MGKQRPGDRTVRRQFHRQDRGFFQAIGNSTSGGKVVPERFIAQGDTVVSLGRQTATARSTGARIDAPVAHIFTARDGMVTSWIGFSVPRLWRRRIPARQVIDARRRHAALSRIQRPLPLSASRSFLTSSSAVKGFCR